ncbi:TetR/AcrR family transcriptional regulator [Nocardiopsis sp. MG754419]|uniref:TetR/AcrR family transcriptional regulator n=1 Tax=Nocardiopsis sp. MG754419 TaxID=2259865 RepID=UPI001BA78A7F|nr:TetR/AcrR family transcriptional regulator [Nocardiopsis sp. MG754419]MBR8740123.1 TetR/AcrR family transcriptional regulator [Nocardiopsis sp. MG754419]
MSGSTRKYNSPRREREANRTQQDILRAARELFIAQGYSRVTVSDIARAAGTAVKTVYVSVGGKSEVLHTLITSDVAGSRASETVAEVGRTTDLATAVGLLARSTRENTERFETTIDLLHSTRNADDAAQQTWERVLQEYRGALRGAAEHLVDIGGVAPHLDVDGVTDRLWFCFGLSAWRTLIDECGWTYDEAERWLGDQAVAMLGAPDPRTASRTPE